MYEYIKGTLVSVSPQQAILDVQGIGYKLYLPIRSIEKLREGESLLLYTSWVVRETSHSLFGFLLKEERDFFEVLIALSGIGPKTALSLIGHLSLEQVGAAVRTNQTALFAKVPGIGKKTAEKLLLDLKNREDLFFPTSSDGPPLSLLMQDAIKALVHLGYSPMHAEKAIQKASSSLPLDAELSLLIRTALSCNS